MNDLLRAEQLTHVWGVKERMCRRIMGELAALGFRLETEMGGQRRCPAGLAEAARVCRSQKKELAALRLDPTAAQFLAPGAAADELDPLEMLIFAATELAIIRESVGVACNSLTTGVAASAFSPLNFTNHGLPDPRHSL